MTSSSSKTAKAAISPINRVKDLLSEYSAEEFGLPHEAESALLTSLYSWTCKAYVALSSVRTGKPFCQEAHRRDPENVDGLVGLGELALKDEEFEEAVRLLSEAFEKGGRSDRSVLEKLQKAQRLLKQSKAKVGSVCVCVREKVWERRGLQNGATLPGAADCISLG